MTMSYDNVLTQVFYLMNSDDKVTNSRTMILKSSQILGGQLFLGIFKCFSFFCLSQYCIIILSAFTKRFAMQSGAMCSAKINSSDGNDIP